MCSFSFDLHIRPCGANYMCPLCLDLYVRSCGANRRCPLCIGLHLRLCDAYWRSARPFDLDNKLLVNIAKCKYMIFHTPQKRVKPLGLKIENTIVERVYLASLAAL